MSVTATNQVNNRVRIRERLTQRKLVVTLLVLLASLIVVASIAVTLGSERISFITVIKIIVAELFGGFSDASPEQRIIVTEIRLPRVLMAVIVGAALSVAGAAYQALLRNPLADPGILGVSSGAALGAIVATVFIESFPFSRPLAAFAGAVATIAVVYALGQKKRGSSPEKLILAGVIVSAMLSSLVIFLVTNAGVRQRSVLSWLIGDLSGEARLLPVVGLFVLTGVLIIYLQARSLNLLMTGEEDALALGVEVKRVEFAVYLAASLITGAAVAVSGAIGFVGLIIPHAVRLAAGSDNRLVVPASALAGGAFLLIADTAARMVIAPREVNVGVITSLIGAPVFIYLLRRTI